MASLSSPIRWKLDVTELSPRAALEWIVNVTSAHTGDFLRWTITLTNKIAPASLLSSTVTAFARKIGIKIEMDLGDGALSRVKGSELAPTFSLSGSLDGYGTRSLTFTRFGDDQNPMKSTFLRGLRSVQMSIYRGVSGAVGEKVMFNGYLQQGSYQAFPPSASISCSDESIKHVDKRLTYTLAAGAERDRSSILHEICTANSIPIGTWELPYGTVILGPLVGIVRDHGGKVYKAISEGGDRSVLEFIREFIEPIGCRMYWRDGLMHIKRFDMSGPVVATLKGDAIRSLSVDPPAANVQNSAKYSASIYAYTGPSGLRTVVDDKVTTGTYAPLVATSVQNHLTGVISAAGLTSSSETRSVSRVVTTTTFDGGTVVAQNIDEYGWFAPRACNKSQSGAGTITYNTARDVYQFADGSWRSTAQEDFQVIRRRSLARSFDADGFLYAEERYVWQYAPIIIPRATLNTGTGAEIPTAVDMTDSGEAWSLGIEQFTAEHDYTTWYQTNDGHIQKAVTNFDSFNRTEYYVTSNPGGAYSGTIYVFGPSDKKIYASNPIQNQFLMSLTAAFLPMDETQHRVTVSTTGGNTFPPSFQNNTTDISQIARAGVFAGPVPFIEQKTANQTAQPATVTVYNDVQTALGGGIDRPDTRQNDYCETDGELRTCAIEDLREKCSPKVTIETDIDARIEEGSVIEVDHPKLGHGVKKLLVWSSSWNITGGIQPSASQTLNCRWYPTELLNT